jgi:hypothetical protein
MTGKCLCGAVRYRITAEPIVTRACWCRLCQYLGAGSGTVNTCFPSESVSIEGRLSDYVSVADSGARMHRRFCGICGTQMFSAAESRPQLLFIRAGTLDTPELVRPAATIWTAAAPSWACIDAQIPSFAGQPPPPRAPE